MTELETIKNARQYLEPGRDYTLAVFIVRDLQVVKDNDLSDLVWAMYQNDCVRSEVEWLLNELESKFQTGETNDTQQTSR